jgi:hypothetical protein
MKKVKSKFLLASIKLFQRLYSGDFDPVNAYRKPPVICCDPEFCSLSRRFYLHRRKSTNSSEAKTETTSGREEKLGQKP